MPSYAELERRVRGLAPLLWRLYTPPVMLLAIIVALRLLDGVPMAEFTRDPAQILGHTPFIGAVSSLGILLWAAAATACLFTAALLRRRGLGAAGWRTFLTFASALTVLLMLDDLFLFHDVVFPEYLGIGEHWLYGFYAASAAGLLGGYRRLILKTDYPLLLLSLLLFAASLGMDFVSDYVLLPGTFLLEDGPKFLGIVAWAAYFIRTSAFALREVMEHPPQMDADRR